VDQAAHERSAAVLQRLPNAEALANERKVGHTLLLDAVVAEALADKTTLAVNTVILPISVAGLSAREIEVLRLIASGKSNKEIAETLFISLNTVLRHVTHIFEKTGCANRAEAATYAARHGLTT
jgi:DNA-binding CsgD family transcriptional regulator